MAGAVLLIVLVVVVSLLLAGGTGRRIASINDREVEGLRQLVLRVRARQEAQEREEVA